MSNAGVDTRPYQNPDARVYHPKVDDMLTVRLPGEVTRARIASVVNDEAVVVELGVTTSKEHRYTKGDFVPCRFVVGNMGLNEWRAVRESELAPVAFAPQPAAIVSRTHDQDLPGHIAEGGGSVPALPMTYEAPNQSVDPASATELLGM